MAPKTSKPILLVTMSGVEIRSTSIFIDRKFHVGMLEYAKRLDRPLACIMPRLAVKSEVMDHVEIERADVPYVIHVVPSTNATPDVLGAMSPAIAGAALVYVGCAGPFNLMAAGLSRRLGVQYVANSEYTLRTELDIMRSVTQSRVRRAIREMRVRALHRRKLGMVAASAELHANGYPTFFELGSVCRRKLLYFDTRALDSDVISENTIRQRLQSLSGRPPRLIYSGRYHPIKGALDVVLAAIELHRLGVDFRLDTYGTGPLKGKMIAAAEQGGAQEKIAIHGPVPYKPDLVEITRNADLFLNCHVQGDPSCTYLETFACGVPIVGYANEMWAPLCKESRAGRAVRMSDPRELALAAMELLRDREALMETSSCARLFSKANTMESAWDRRAARLSALADGAEEGATSTSA